MMYNTRSTNLLFLLFIGLLSGCQSAYYSTMEKFGVEKRDILVDRVEEAKEARYEIPGNSRIRIVKSIDQPILIHYNDTRVASEDVPYESILLDKSISWELDPGITIHRKANLETDAISGSQILGEEMITYNISR